MNDVAVDGRVEDGEVDVGVRVSGVEEVTEADGVGCSPKHEDVVDIGKVVEEAIMLVPALAGTHEVAEGEKGREVVVDGVEFVSEEVLSGDKPLFANKDKRHPFCNII